MASLTCSRCFAVFEAEAQGGAPLCPRCARRVEPAHSQATPLEDLDLETLELEEAPRPSAGARRLLPWAAGGAAALALLGAGIAGLRWLRAPSRSAPAVEPNAVELEVGAWRAEGRVKADGDVASHLRAGRRALRADLPERTAEARRAYMAALALAPADPEAIAGYVTAFAWLSDGDPDATELAGCHRMMRWALPRAGGRPDLAAAQVYLLLASGGADNAAEALKVARRAEEMAPGSAPALLALGSAMLEGDPRAAAELFARAAAGWPGERRALRLAAEARWRARDGEAALELAARRLALDPGQPQALALAAAIEMASARFEAARDRLERWARSQPKDSRPRFELGRIALQIGGDPAAARRHFVAALSAKPGDFLAARILAHLAAAERVSGDLDAARRALAEAVRRVPGSAAVRYQEALLAYRLGDFHALREAAGVLGDRAGERAARILAARVDELDGRARPAADEHEAAARLAPRDLAAQLEAAGALARLGVPEKALAVAAGAESLDPADPRARRAVEEYWEGPGPLAEAAAQLARLADRDPRIEARAAAGAAAAELAIGRTRAAEQLARRAVLAEPGAIWPRVVLAQVLLEQGRPREALVEADAAVAAAGARDGTPHELRARALEALGRTAAADQARREALRADPQLATARLGAALSARRLGDERRAREILEALLAAEPGYAMARGALLGP